MTVLVIVLGIGLGNYAHFALRGHSILFRRRAPIPKGMVPYRRGRRREWAEGLAEAAFFIVLWPAQLGFWVAYTLNEHVFEPLRSWLWGVGK